MNWLITAILSAIFFATSNAITSLFQTKLSTGLGMTVFASGVLSASLFMLIFIKQTVITSVQSGSGIYLALLSGFIWAFGQLFFILMLSKNAPLSIAIPIVVGGIGIGGVITGLIMFHESLTVIQIIGISIVLIGSIILAKG